MLNGKDKASLRASLGRFCEACTIQLGLRNRMMDSGRLSGRVDGRYTRGERCHHKVGRGWRGWSFCIPCGKDDRWAGEATFL